MHLANGGEGPRPRQRDRLVIASEIKKWPGSAGNLMKIEALLRPG